jgi:hypothetical protein
MNETDVREVIVRPLIERLGYKYGTQAHIRTEVHLKYEKAFLGHKKKTDPPLAGRADYICDAISYGRWAVEVKKPAEVLTQDDVEQAHTYCAHPEIGAHHFLLTNGKEFRLYVTGQLDKPILAWGFAETEQHILTLFNIVGYEAIKKRAAILSPDVNKPLGKGIASKLRIIAGEVAYGDHRSDHPLFQIDALTGKIGTITGGAVHREQDGRLCAHVIVRSPYQDLEKINKLAGLGDYTFWSADEYVSTDQNKPTVFQNVVDGRIEPGTPIRIAPGIPEIPLPIGFQFTVFTEAIGYFDGKVFTGFLSFDYDYTLIRGRPTGNIQVDQLLRTAPSKAKLIGEGTFKVITANA